MKKTVLFIMALAIIISGLCFPAYAADIASGTCGDNVRWTLAENGTLTISGRGAMTDFNRADYTDFNPAYGDVIAPWYDYHEMITRVVIENGVTSIGNMSFIFYESLRSVDIPGSVEKIGSMAFDMTGLTSVTIPRGVKSIGESAFSGCTSLKSVVIGDTVEEIGSQAFMYTGLTSVTIPKSVKVVNRSAFANSAIREVIIEGATELRDFPFTDANTVVYFRGDMPVMDSYEIQNAFGTVIAVYPSDNPTWNADSLKDTRYTVWFNDRDAVINDPPRDASEPLETEMSNNADMHEYYFVDYGHTVDSHMFTNPDGTYTRVEHLEEQNKVVVEVYSSGNELQWKKTIDMELPIWGGFFAGEKYNFFVFGQSNPDKLNSNTVVRVVRYTKNWHRVDSVEIKGANTAIPFWAGSLSMAEQDDMLYIHTCHEMYSGHQANMQIQIFAPDVPFMNVTSCKYSVSYSGGYVSHSFNQFVITDGDDVVRVDHGDAYPRAVTILQSRSGHSAVSDILLEIKGSTGANTTGVAIGGLEASDSGYIVAGNTVRQDDSYDPDSVRNIFVSFTDRETMESQFRWITNYTESSGVYVSNPHLVKLSGNSLMLIWGETGVKGGAFTTLKYALLDAKGNLSTRIYSDEGRISDCAPIVMNGQVQWYVTDKKGMTMYSISLPAMKLTAVIVARDPNSPDDPDDPDTPDKSIDITSENKDVTAEVGEKVNLIVSPGTGRITYQWQFSEDNGETWHDCSPYDYSHSFSDPDPTGSTTASYTITAQTFWHDNLFRCVMTDRDGNVRYSYSARLTVKSAAPQIKKGDINDDGQVTNADLILVARNIVNLVTFTDRQKLAADMNDDGMIDNVDLIKVARIVVGLS